MINEPTTTRYGGSFFALSLRAYLAHIVAVETEFWSRAKPRTVQFIMGSASFVWAYAVYCEADTGFLLTPYDLMRALWVAWIWEWLFVAHGICVLICRWSISYLWRLQLFTNCFGFTLWTFYVASAWYSLGHMAIGTALEIVMIGMNAWLIMRTLRKPSSSAPGDDIRHEFTDNERLFGGRDALKVAAEHGH